ncbi:MAG: LemA family protein [Endomicrobiales bacterium]|nr:LemA family protein [Endomicrobiales bacterium]
MAYIFPLLVIAFVVFVILVYNKLTKYRIAAENSWKQIDVQLKRRYDLIPNLVETAKGYMKHEQDTLTKVMEARNRGIAAKTPAEAGKAEGEISGLLRQLFAVVENYPDLKANENMLRLQEELTSTENKISYSRAHYNDVVANYTYLKQQFPSNIVASFFNFPVKEYFEIRGAEREAPKVKF